MYGRNVLSITINNKFTLKFLQSDLMKNLLMYLLTTNINFTEKCANNTHTTVITGDQKFRESTYLFEYLIRVWKNSTKYDHPQKIREINSNFFSKNVDLTEKMLIFT